MTRVSRSIGVLVAGLILAGFGSMSAAAAAPARSATPYQDPSAVGYIGLCDKAGQQITHGSLNTKPFAWRAVSSQPAAAPYNAAGRTATLFAYQPRQDVPAGDWSGDALTASARYTNPANPMVAATDGDLSLKDFTEEFGPQWDGLLQLRIFLGVPDKALYSFTYPALNIRVTGNTWRAVGGGAVSCDSGRATSVESVLLPKSALTGGHHHKSKSAPGAAASPSARSTPARHRSGRGHRGRAAAALPAAADNAATSGSGGHTATIIGVLVAAVILFGAGGFIANRRRAKAFTASSAHGTSEKGR